MTTLSSGKSAVSRSTSNWNAITENFKSLFRGLKISSTLPTWVVNCSYTLPFCYFIKNFNANEGACVIIKRPPEPYKSSPAVELSMTSKIVLPAMWITTEVRINNHEHIKDLKLIFCSPKNTFNNWICGNVVRTRDVCYSLPDYEKPQFIVCAESCRG